MSECYADNRQGNYISLLPLAELLDEVGLTGGAAARAKSESCANPIESGSKRKVEYTFVYGIMKAI